MSKVAPSWPVIAGSYKVGDPAGPVAVCALTSERLVNPLVGLPGVAIAGMVYTANLGITRIVVNITANPAIRFLLICGRDSPLFKPGQSLVALSEHGVDDEKKIVGAAGYDPVLATLSPDQIKQFRKQVEVLDWTGEEDVEVLRENISGLFARSPGVFKREGGTAAGPIAAGENFVSIRPGGQREPLVYDPKGYFVISLDREQEEIVLRHYLPDHTPAHEMRGRGATSMLLGLLREGLVTQLSHAGYLGEELAKAQTALQFGLRYDQDRPLRPSETPVKTLEAPAPVQSSEQRQPTDSQPQIPAKMPAIRQPITLQELQSAGAGSKVDLVLSVSEISGPQKFTGDFLVSDEAEPFNAFHRTQERIVAEWAPSTRIIMGVAGEIATGSMLRISGRIDENRLVHVEQLVILTKVARIVD